MASHDRDYFERTATVIYDLDIAPWQAPQILIINEPTNYLTPGAIEAIEEVVEALHR